MAVAVSDLRHYQSAPRIRAPVDNDDLLRALAQAAALAQRTNSAAVALALEEFGQIDLPDVAPASAGDQLQIRAIAPLYLAAQLEEARLLPVIETLSALAASGGILIDLGASAAQIEDFWRGRNDRFHETERRALFTRLFGADDLNRNGGAAEELPVFNDKFENLMIDLCESLYKFDEEGATNSSFAAHVQVRVLMAARNLAENLLDRSGGMTPFAANEILGTIQSAVQILQQPSLQRAFGARSLWTLVRAVATRYLHFQPDTSAYVTRGKSGLILLSWLADSLPLVNSGQPLLTVAHPAIGAAAEWLQASLIVREAQTGG
jgi:hypothetical protein